MKLFWFLIPFIFILSACSDSASNEMSDETLLDDSIQIFKFNAVLLQEQINHADKCYAEIEKTLKVENVACAEYVATRDFTDEFNEQAIELLLSLYNEGYLVEGDPKYEEIVTLVKFLAHKQEEAEKANQEIVDFITGGCKDHQKCAL